MWKFLVGMGMIGVLVGAPAQAVNIGGLVDVDPNLGVASFTGASGSFSTNSHPNNDLGALGNNWGGVFIGDSTAQRRLNFLGSDPGPGGDPNVFITANFLNPIVNNAGIDVVLFEQGDPPTDGSNVTVAPDDPTNDELELIAASLDGSNGSFADFSVLGFLTSAQVGGSATSFGVYVFGLDLSLLGVADGASVSSLVFGNTGAFLDHDPDIVWGGGVAAAIPVPAALPLMASVVGLLGVAGWRRRRQLR